MSDKSMINRRDFIKKSSLASAALSVGTSTLSARSYSRIMGANDRVNVAQIGCKRRADAMKSAFRAMPEKINVSYVCDIYVPQMERFGSELNKTLGYTPKMQGDLRRILEDKDVDALIHCTPDHWHGVGAIMTLEAGKHAYVEKPCSHNPWEGEMMVAAQKKYGKVVQMGNQQRSALESIDIIKQIHEGIIGEVYGATAFYSNNRGSIGKAKVAEVPAGFDWELFQGPAPRAPYKDMFFDYNWHWVWEYGTGETGNNSIHELDVARWALGVAYPEEVSVTGGKYHFKDDDWVMYDTLDATFHFSGNRFIRWDGKCRTNYQTYGADRGTIVYGSEGTVYVDRNRYRLYDRDGKLVREATAKEMNATTALGGGGNATNLHVLNFVEAIQGKAKPTSPIDEGVKSTLLAHLAKIAYRTGSVLKCNPENGHIKDQKAMKLWKREYEKGWEPKV
jgi:predicted dehydrogenase